MKERKRKFGGYYVEVRAGILRKHINYHMTHDGYRQGEMADLIGVLPTTISQLMRSSDATIRMAIQTAMAFCKGLDLCEDDVIIRPPNYFAGC